MSEDYAQLYRNLMGLRIRLSQENSELRERIVVLEAVADAAEDLSDSINWDIVGTQHLDTAAAERLMQALAATQVDESSSQGSES